MKKRIKNISDKSLGKVKQGERCGEEEKGEEEKRDISRAFNDFL